MSNRIEKTIEIHAPVERVWRALTDHEEFGTWFRVRLDGPFVPGELTSGQMTYPGHEHVKWHSRTTRLEAPRLFAFEWPHSAEAGPDFSGPTNLVEFLLEPTETGTRLTVVETGFELMPEDKRLEALRGNEQGWTEQMGNIKAYVEA